VRPPALTFYAGRDNAEDLVLLSDGAPVDTSSFTRVVLELDDELVVDSSVIGAAFEWPVSLTYQGTQVNGLRLELAAAGLAARTYGDTRLTVYDPAYPNGLVWTEAMTVRVRA